MLKRVAIFFFMLVVGAFVVADERKLLWGDTHLHTSYSFDAFLNGNQSADPDVAYRYARGLPVIHPYNRTRVQIGTPLDFLVVTDHAEFYGGIRDIYNDGINDPDAGLIDGLLQWYGTRQIRQAIDEGEGPAYFADQLPKAEDPVDAASRWSDDTGGRLVPGVELSASNAWARLGKIADSHNAPGTFTALLGWEWSTIPGGANLHRVVVSDADAETASEFMPFSSVTSPYPEDLWAWLESTSAETGVNFVAIPHNSNISKGQMFADQTLRGEAFTAEYAETRARWEPVVEVTQIKGDSETLPEFSPDDPFADFELYPWYIQQDRAVAYEPKPGDYIRPALRTGLALEAELGVNPFRFGVIGSTDSHTGLSSAEEPNFWGKMAYDSIPENKSGRTIAGGPTGWTMQAGGLAAVWADENDRGAIVEAFKRREVYATTGSRIALRLAAGFGLPDDADVDAALEAGVPMGGILSADGQDGAPMLIVSASRDPQSAALDRVQVVKGWVDSKGQTHEAVFDVAWSGDRAPGADGKVPPVPNTVDLKTGHWTDEHGAAELGARWQDPQFDPTQAAFYYVRVLEIPTPRHSHLDAIALGLEAAAEGPPTIQERAYSSPVWYTP